MYSHEPNSVSEPRVQVRLDGSAVELPHDRSSLIAIHSYLDRLALERQRILLSFTVDGQPADRTRLAAYSVPFSSVEGATLELEHLPLQLIETALKQTQTVRARVESAVALVLINEGRVAREFWWELTQELKEPLLTLSLIPEPDRGVFGEQVSLAQLRKWQLHQLGRILKQVDEACHLEDLNTLSNALENRVLPWLESLSDSISLWHQTWLAGLRDARPVAV